MRDGKRRAESFGRRAEARAVLALRLFGWRIRARNVRIAGGEIDIIAERGDTLAFIEVKARADLDTATHALGPAQRGRIVRTAEAWLAAHPPKGGVSGPDIRFDVMLVRPWGWPKRIVGAFRADGL